MRRDRDDRSRNTGGEQPRHSNNDQGSRRRPGLEDFKERGMPEVVDTFSPPPRPGTGDSDGSNKRRS